MQTQFENLKNAYRATLPKGAEVEWAYARFLRKLESYKATTKSMGWGISQILVMPQLLRAASRSVGVLAVVVLVSFGVGIAAVSALPGIVPGDALYGMKLATERAQASLAFAPEAKARLELEFAGRRLEETATLLEGNLPDREERVRAAVGYFKEHLEKTQSSLRASPARSAVEVAKTIDRKATEYEATLNRTGAEASAAVREEVREAQDASQEAAFTAVTVLVEQQKTGELSLAELEAKVQSKLRELEASIQLVSHRLAQIPGGAFPEVEAIGGPTLGSLYRDIGRARSHLEQGKNLLAAGGFSAALEQYREGVGMLNHLEWSTALYERVLADRVAVEAAAAETPIE